MEQDVVTKKFKIGGMTCINCENRIKNALQNTAGIITANVSYATSTADVTYNTDDLSEYGIEAVIEQAGYKVIKNSTKNVQANNITKIITVAAIVFALYIIFQHYGVLNLFNFFPKAEVNMGYGMLFVIGLLTSVHCIAMCGGINLSQCIPNQKNSESNNKKTKTLVPSLLYNAGRVISYTVIGGIVGTIGSAVSFSGSLKGIVQILAGIFMVIMGINLLGLFPSLQKLSPHMPRFFADKINKQKQSKSPLYVGLLNGLMPCGPLQAMQLYALSTGSPLKGALSMFLFSLGTVPLMFGLGALSSLLSKKFTKKVMAVGAVLVIFLGVTMFSYGFTLSGFSFTSKLPSTPPVVDSSNSSTKAQNPVAQIDGDIQTVTTSLSSGRYTEIYVTVGTPVKWTISASESDINGCNGAIVIPEYNIQLDLHEGENIIEFTPVKTGKFTYSCWMGMIGSYINVLNEGDQAPTANTENDEPQSPDTRMDCCG
ncbi:heavy metal-associated domain-containing protein [Clostridia bacterium]|nr:heavy metal-associated domain-containing protein [Clostridia bacterium]